MSGRIRVEIGAKSHRRRGWAATPAEAEALKRKFREEIAAEVGQGSKVLRNLGKVILADLVSPPGSPGTRDDLVAVIWRGRVEPQARSALLVITEWMKRRPLESLTSTDLSRLALWVEKDGERSAATANRYVSYLRTIMEKLVGDGRLAAVPKFDWLAEDEGRIIVLTMEEEAQVLALLAGWATDGNDAANIHDLVQVALDTGCRRDELLDLEPKDVRLRAARPHLELVHTKAHARRVVPLAPRSVLILSRRPNVFRGVTSASVRYWWARVRRAMGREGDEDFVFHACRHTCITRLFELGMIPDNVRKWAGHADLKTTLRYSHVSDQGLFAGADLIAGLYAGALSRTTDAPWGQVGTPVPKGPIEDRGGTVPSAGTEVFQELVKGFSVGA